MDYLDTVSSSPKVVVKHQPEHDTPLSYKWLQYQAPSTRESYTKEMRDYSDYAYVSPNLYATVEHILSSPRIETLRLVTDYVRHLKDSGYGPAKINKLYSAVASLTSYARTLGVIDWDLHFKHIPTTPVMSTAGANAEEVRHIFDVLEEHSDDPQCQKLYVCVYLWYICGLRRAEVWSIQVEDVDLQGCRILLKRKCRSEKEYRDITELGRDILASYIDSKGYSSGPLIRSEDGTPYKTPNALNMVMRRLFDRLGLTHTHPHAFRHSGATAVASETKSINEVKHYGNWKSVSTIGIYIDKAADLERKTSSMLEQGLFALS